MGVLCARASGRREKMHTTTVRSLHTVCNRLRRNNHVTDGEMSLIISIFRLTIETRVLRAKQPETATNLETFATNRLTDQGRVRESMVDMADRHASSRGGGERCGAQIQIVLDKIDGEVDWADSDFSELATEQNTFK